MCLIIFSPNFNRSTIRKSILEKGFDENSDGAGFAYLENGLIKISQSYFDFDKFYESYKQITVNLSGPILIHFRWATKGSNNNTNTQPLFINEHLVMAHNGIFEGLSLCSKNLSDSVNLSRIIKRLKWEFPFNNAQKDLLKALCSERSKLVFLNKNGQYNIINEQLGAWRAGCWYSDGGTIFKKHPWEHSDIEVYPTEPEYKKQKFDKIIQKSRPFLPYHMMNKEERLNYDEYLTTLIREDRDNL